MAKKIKKVYNTKLLYRWSGQLWFTLLFMLVVVAPLGVSLFMPVLTFTGDAAYPITSRNLVMALFQRAQAPVTAFQTSVIDPIKGMNNIIGMVLEVSVKYVIPAFAILMAVFEFVLGIFFLVGLISGRFFHWKGPFLISLWATIQGFLYFGLIIGLSIYLNTQFPNIPAMASYKLDFLYSAIFLGVMLVGTIILGIIYAAGFKGREFIPNKTYLDNYIQQMNHGMSNSLSYTPQPIIINNNTNPNPVEKANNVQAPAIQKEQPKVETRVVTKVKKVRVTEVDQSLKFISGHAYAKNIYLKSANIPEGVDKIGASAFANCVNLKSATIPASVKEIAYNAFFNCKNLEKIVYAGTKEQWRQIKRGSNWLSKAGTNIVSCLDGAIQVNPYRK